MKLSRTKLLVLLDRLYAKEARIAVNVRSAYRVNSMILRLQGHLER
jgi:hypothetical protein